MPFKFASPLSIQNRLILLCLSVALPLLAIGSFVIWKEYRTLNNQAKQDTEFQAAICVKTLSHWIYGQENMLSSLAEMPQITMPDQNFLKTALQSHSEWQDLYLVSPEGQILPDGPNICKAPGAGKLLQEILADKKPGISGYLIEPVLQKPALLVGAPVVRSGHIQAILLASVKPQAVLALYQELGQDSQTVIDVIDADNRVIARTLESKFFQGRDFSQARTVKAGEKKWRGTLEVTGIADPTPRAYAFDHMPKTNWLVVVGIPTKLIYGPSQNWLALVIGLAFFAVVLAGLLAYATTRQLTGSIYELVRVALAIGRGDLACRSRITDGGEIGLLGQAFNAMAENLEMNREHALMVEKIAESIRQSLDLPEILNTTVSELGKALAASRCCLALINANQFDQDAQDLSFDYVWSNEKAGGSPLKNRIVRITKMSLLKTIIEQGTPLWLDVLQDQAAGSLFEHNEVSPSDWLSIKSLIAAPITINDKTHGLIVLHQCDKHRVWSQPEQKLVEAVARHSALAIQQAKLYGKTKSLAEQEQLINHIVRSVRSSLDLSVILDTVTGELGAALGADRCQIIEPRPEGHLYVSQEYAREGLQPMKGLNVVAQRMDFRPSTSDNQKKTLLGIDLAAFNQKPDGKGVVADAPLAVISDWRTDKRTKPFAEFLSQVGTKSLIAAPLLEDARLLGILIVHQCQKTRVWTDEEQSLVSAIADQVAVAMSHGQLFAQVKHQAITDGLTGLYNHIYLKSRLSQELRRAERKGQPLSLLMLDLDLLKQINDSFGHPVGDQAIRAVAWTLKNLLRSGDTAARYGGEEFAVILPETPLAEAGLIAERLCRQVNNLQVSGVGQISISVGAASFPHQAKSAEELVELADKALYVAKRRGRNQIAIWDEKSPSMAEIAGKNFVVPKDK